MAANTMKSRVRRKLAEEFALEEARQEPAGKKKRVAAERPLNLVKKG